MCIKFEKHICIERPQLILDALHDNVELSKQQLKKLMQNGALWLENAHGINRVRRVKKNLKQGDQLHVYYDEAVQAALPPAAKLIADEGEYSVWNKPCGMYSQGTKWGDHFTIYRWAEQNLKPQRQAFIVHRLDKAANGLMVIAHTKKISAAFSKMFERREMHKTYRAVVHGMISEQSLPGFILPYEINKTLDNKTAISEIISVDLDDQNNHTIVEITIKTGRKHQIRRHLSGIGYPIIGDRLYGEKKSQLDLQLSSIELEFVCPVTAQHKKYSLR